MYAAKEFKLLYPSPKRKRHRASDTNLDTPLQFLLDESAQLSNDAMGLVVEIILLNLIFTLLHKHFFSGEHFFGVGSDTLYEYLETMLSKLVAGGKFIYLKKFFFIPLLTISHHPENSDPTAIQRWRSMTVEAIFQMNDGIDSQLNKELSSDLIRLLKIVFPCSLRRSKKSKQSYKEIIRGEQQSILDVIRQARRLSLMIQHNIVSCQLLVTVASTSQSSSDGEALGTRAFGLKRITGSECTVLMKTELITTSLLQSLLQNTTS